MIIPIKTNFGSLENRIDDVVVDAHLIVVSFHKCVSLISPKGTPTVSHNPNINAVLGTIANNCHDMIWNDHSGHYVSNNSRSVQLNIVLIKLIPKHCVYDSYE